MRHKPFALGALVAALALLSACGASGEYSENGSGGYAGESPSAPPRSGGDSGDAAGPGGVGSPEPGQGSPSPSPGQLTAGDWDDNLNFSFFQKYLTEAPQGMPAHPSTDRVVITVRDEEGRPVPNARVTVGDAAGKRLEAPTATDGRLLFLPTQDGAQGSASFSVTVSPPPGQPGTAVTTSVEGSAWNLTLPGARGELPTELDVAFVVDATGSMGDEINYLKAELQNIVDSVRGTYPDVSARFALVMYRDDGDEYVVRSFDFTSDVAVFRQRLSEQSAGGGGDYPEAMERGLGAIHQLTWRTGNTARLTFLVADAPTHTQHYQAFVREANRARLSGIKVYPVAASGVADEAEYLMRLAAQLTLGRYIFLTNDSGIGDPHAEPHIPCYQVQLLKHLLVRAIGSELAGRRLPASGTEILRSVGSPAQDGSCTRADGTVTYL
ncbi:von Willebrand factor type A domain-containing protein [Archangium gephyra]|uniref:von Willebrand factor type A domain-containing protein n=1 Tax=Archangium gephyra TaxID=48 RepID=A0ABX9JK03_9BACT|nr:VWA domain-containing protein [Archangium gephyra]REG13823.1 von Willebrand factor type A domain-containing protein [Archangium gephyra]